MPEKDNHFIRGLGREQHHLLLRTILYDVVRNLITDEISQKQKKEGQKMGKRIRVEASLRYAHLSVTSALVKCVSKVRTQLPDSRTSYIASASANNFLS